MSDDRAMDKPGEVEFLVVSKQIPLEYEQGDLPGRYATNLTVQHTEHEFIISFYEARPPVIVGSPEERSQKVALIDHVRAQCVARVIVAASRMQEFVDVLHQNLEKYQDTFWGEG